MPLPFTRDSAIGITSQAMILCAWLIRENKRRETVLATKALEIKADQISPFSLSFLSKGHRKLTINSKVELSHVFSSLLSSLSPQFIYCLLVCIYRQDKDLSYLAVEHCDSDIKESDRQHSFFSPLSFLPFQRIDCRNLAFNDGVSQDLNGLCRVNTMAEVYSLLIREKYVRHIEASLELKENILLHSFCRSSRAIVYSRFTELHKDFQSLARSLIHGKIWRRDSNSKQYNLHEILPSFFQYPSCLKSLNDQISKKSSRMQWQCSVTRFILMTYSANVLMMPYKDVELNLYQGYVLNFFNEFSSWGSIANWIYICGQLY